MEQRIKFREGQQRRFLKKVIQNLRCFSLRGILQFGFEVNYNSLKNYYSERRLMKKSFFDSLCYLAKIDAENFKVEYLRENWGKVKGGRIGKRK